ncbi:MAG TPA: exodeoxyribonuclease III [Euzebya sp.]|nr:exodeoxyribonuclease III [Euzebya sp.]
MRIASWNVNSLPVRMPRVLEFLALHRPDVLCLQETKVRPEAFPHLELQVAGYSAIDHSGGGRAGVALLVADDHAVSDVHLGLPDQPDVLEARWVEAVVEGVRVASVYVPNGRSVDHPAFAMKLAFLDCMVRHVAGWGEGEAVVAGDFNVAPGDLDVYDPVRYIGSTHTTPRERDALQRMQAAGLRDAFRVLHPDEHGFTWWDYRAGNFHKNLGMRIDLFMASDPLLATPGDGADHAVGPSYVLARDFRKGHKPSDHAPIVLTVTKT